MPKQQHQEATAPKIEPTGCLAVLARLTWMAFGNFAWFLAAAFVAQRRAPVLMDVVFFSISVALIAVRYLDITKLHGHTAHGAPATLGHWRRYAIVMIVISGVVWGLARLFAARGGA